MGRLSIAVNGALEAEAAFRRKAEYAPRELKNAMRRISTRSARAIKAAMKRRRTGLLYKSIGSKVSESRPGRLVALAGPRRGYRTVIVAEAGRNTVHGLRQDRKGNLHKVVLKRAPGVKPGMKDKEGRDRAIDPVRYAHLADKGFKHRGGKQVEGQHFMEEVDRARREPDRAEIEAAIRSIAKA